MERKKMSKYHDLDKTILPQIRSLYEQNANLQVRYIDKLEETFLFRIREFAPKRTGAYAASWQTKEKTTDRIVFWTSMPDLFIILEYGVGPFEITPNTKKVLRFVDSAGNVVFTMRVPHPGIRAKPHARLAFEDTIRDAIDILYSVIVETYPWLRRG
jgi:hypothetical protein